MATTSFRLRSAVAVSPSPSREDYQPGRVYWLDEGTEIGDILPDELGQLAPGHFEGDDGGTPEDWRTDEATLAHDGRQAKAQRAEAKERDRRRAEKRKAG